MTLTVVPIRDNAPGLNDIPNQLRQLADQIATGKLDMDIDALLVVIPGDDNEWPHLFNYGRYLGNRETVGLFELAKVRTIDLARALND